jgi:hypothetical protein
MLKAWQIGDQTDDHNRGELRYIQELLVPGFEAAAGEVIYVKARIDKYLQLV